MATPHQATPIAAGSAALSADAVYRKVSMRIIPIILLCYFFGYLDRVNIGFAKLQMMSELNLTEAAYGVGAGLFFIGYLLLQVPAGYLVKRVGVRACLGGSLLAWGIVSIATLLTRNQTTFYALRFLLGLTEASFFPAVIAYFSMWFPSFRLSKVMSLLFLAMPLGVIIGGPLSGWIMDATHGGYGLNGWQWMFLIEGLPAVILGFVLFAVIVDRIEDAKWLSRDELAVVTSERQVQQLPYAHTSFFTTEPAEELADLLVDAAPEGLGHVYFVSGGSEAMEAALKLARQYFVEKGLPERRHFIARRQSYHGNTLGALAIGGNAWRREPFLPILIEAHHVTPCYAYREQRADETEEAFAQRLADELEAKILELGPETVAAFVAETVVGATAGAVPPVREYFHKIRAVCDRYGVLLILDEVMSGMGRTGYLFACEEDGVSPDILAIAKGLGAGYQAIGATLVSDGIYDTIVGGSGFFQHGHTYIGHATACAAALAVQKVIAQDRLLDNVKARGEELRALLAARYAGHPHIGDVRGRGLFTGVELVRDRASRQPFDPKHKLHGVIKSEAMKRGLMVYPMGGTVDGQNGDHVLLAPPFICTSAQIGTIVERLADAIDGALSAIGANVSR